jgi:hypothetical protein
MLTPNDIKPEIWKRSGVGAMFVPYIVVGPWQLSLVSRLAELSLRKKG